MTEPHIIRQNTPHEVTVTEGAQVASTRSNDPHGPQVRKVLANEDAADSVSEQGPGIPPPLAQPMVAPSSQIFERHASSVSVDLQSAPEALARESADEAIVFERSLQSEDAAALPDAPAPPPAAGGVVFERSIQDADAELAGAPASAAAASVGPVIARSLQDHRETLPEEPAPAPASDSPTFERSSADRFVAAPAGSPAPDNFQALPPEGLGTPDRFVSPAEGSAPVNVQAIPDPVVRPDAPPQPPPVPELPPVSAAQALAEVMETAKEIQEEVEETLGTAEPVWVEMDFPARVVRLKIENDKVRAKLESLEAMSRSF